MATVRAALRAAAQTEQVEQGVTLAAEVMAPALEINQAYCTVFHAMLEVHTGDLHYIDAGHGHARLLRGTDKQELLTLRSAPIGLLPDTSFLPGKVSLGHGDTLVVFSDGLLDLRPDLATKDVQLPHDARRAKTAQEMVDILAAGSRTRDLPDDVTVLALRRL